MIEAQLILPRIKYILMNNPQQKEKAINHQELSAKLNLLSYSQTTQRNALSVWCINPCTNKQNIPTKKYYAQKCNINHNVSTSQKVSHRYNTLQSKRTLDGQSKKKQRREGDQRRYSIQFQQPENRTKISFKPHSSIKLSSIKATISHNNLSTHESKVCNIRNNTSLIHLLKNKSINLHGHKGGNFQKIIHNLSQIKHKIMTKTIEEYKCLHQSWISMNRLPNCISRRQAIHQPKFKPYFHQKRPILQQYLKRRKNQQQITNPLKIE